jgi:SAM-dependent methyltransferase
MGEASASPFFMTPKQYWQANSKLQHITPPNERYPEIGLDKALSMACRGHVFEFGCGDGRLSKLFNSKMYQGYDINEHAIAQARINNPYHQYVSEWKQADVVLAYTVLLHIPDNEIQEVIERMKAYKRIVIGEITGRKWRRNGNPPVFNREVSEYVEMIGIIPNIIKVPYPRYKCELDLMVFDAN